MPHIFEYMLENNPLRAYVREMLEVKPLMEAARLPCIENALHIACGCGDATGLILKHFPIRKVFAVDRDEKLVQKAKKKKFGIDIDFSAQDARSLDFANDQFDAIFDLADLHNFADWGKALGELHRVLKPNGVLVLEELTLESFEYAAGKFFKATTEHPYESMFAADELREALEKKGFEIAHYEEKRPFRLLKYIVVIAKKVGTETGHGV